MSKSDSANVPYSSLGDGPAPIGAPITIHTPSGPKTGTMTEGGYASPDK